MWLRKEKFRTLAKEILDQKLLRAPSTYAPAKTRLDRLSQYFGDLPLSKVTEKKWEGYVLWRLKDRPGSKFFDDRKYMKQVILEAYQRKIIDRPLKLRIPDVPTNVGKEITTDEIRRLRANASPELRFHLDIALLMGLRKNEMFRLRWDQFDWDREIITLEPADTKTRKGRIVPINQVLLPEFKKRFAGRASKYVLPGAKNLNKPRQSNRRQWRTCKRRADVKARWHDWRHTCASIMLRVGNSLEAVKKYLGMSMHILLRIYAHLNIDDLRKVEGSMRLV